MRNKTKDDPSARIIDPALHHFYHYRFGYRFDPGASAEAFLSPFDLPVVSIKGAGRGAGWEPALQLRVEQPPQVWVPPVVKISGIGGLQAGTFRLNALVDTSNNG